MVAPKRRRSARRSPIRRSRARPLPRDGLKRRAQWDDRPASGAGTGSWPTYRQATRLTPSARCATLRAANGTELEPELVHVTRQRQTETNPRDTPKLSSALVGGRHHTEQRVGPGSQCVHLEGSQAHRALAQALCRTQPSPEERAVSLGHVDVDVLHQSGWSQSGKASARRARAREGRAATVVSPAGVKRRAR